MELKHYLSYLQNTITSKWSDLAMKDLDGATQYTYGELAAQIARLHTTFRLLGIKEGDKIALCGRNCSNWGVLFLAVETYKAVAVSILPDFTGEGIHALVNHSEAKLLYTGPNVLKKIDAKEMPGLSALILMDDFSLKYAASEEIEKTYDSIDEAFAKEYPNGVQAADVNYPTDNHDDLALLNYTSGSTGNPKGVMLTHRNLSGNVDFAVKRLPHKEGDKVLSMLPIAHMFGLMFEFLYQVCDGAEVYFLTKAPTPTTLMKAFAQVHPFMILTVPLVIEKIIKGKVLPVINKPLMKVLWKTPGIKKLLHNKINSTLLQAFGGKLRYLIIGGAALNEEVEKCMKDMNFMYCVGYGMTECAPLISYEDWYRYAYRSCGKIISGMQIRIDSEDPTKKEGEVQVYGVNVMKGYYKNEQATKEAFTEDGWLRTGDLGIIDKEGNLFLRGRSKNMLLSPNGQNIYPEEIEDKLNSLPLVTESVVVDRNHKLVALVYSDPSLAKADVLQGRTIEEVMKENLQKANKVLPNYSQLTAIELVEKEFEKTPKRSIKRFMYK
ncbi:MAG: AMP-binding protein [Paludibacteraceae bacterium]|nr:AMP-binding protein [Paludibacteraceae bacterium]